MPDVRLLYRLVERRAVQEDWAGVLALIDRIREIQGTSPDPEDRFFLGFHRGLALVETGAPAEAVPLLAEVVEIDPDHVAARLLLADALLRDSRWDEARAQLEAALERAPDHPGCLCALGWVLYQRGERARGRQLLERATELHPHYPPGHVDLGLILAGEARWEEAEFHLEAAMALTPDDADVAEALRVVREGRAGEAVERQQVRALLPEIRAQRRGLTPEERQVLRRLRAWLRSHGATHLEVLLVEGVWAEVAAAGSRPRRLDDGWAAGLAWACHRMLGHSVRRREVARHWGVSVDILARRYRVIRRLLDAADAWPPEDDLPLPSPTASTVPAALIPVDFQSRRRLPATTPCPCGSGLPVETCRHTEPANKV